MQEALQFRADTEALAEQRAERYVHGDPLDPATTLGPVATAAAAPPLDPPQVR